MEKVQEIRRCHQRTKAWCKFGVRVNETTVLAQWDLGNWSRVAKPSGKHSFSLQSFAIARQDGPGYSIVMIILRNLVKVWEMFGLI